MAAGRYVSRVFDAGEALYDALVAASWPAHPATGRTPTVEFADEDPDYGEEKVVLVANPDEAVTEWARASPAGRDESMVFQAVIRSFVVEKAAGSPPSTQLPKWQRLAALSAVAEGVVYNTSTERVVPLGFTGEVPIGRVAGVQPEIINTKHGAVGIVTVTYALRADI